MKTVRHWYRVLLTSAVLLIMPPSASAALGAEWVVIVAMNQSLNESAVISATLSKDTRAQMQRGAEVFYTYVVRNSEGAVIGELNTAAPSRGMAQVRITAELTTSGEVVLHGSTRVGEDVIIGIIDTGIDLNRANYEVDISVLDVRDPLTSNEVSLPPSVGMITNATTYNTATGVTTSQRSNSIHTSCSSPLLISNGM